MLVQSFLIQNSRKDGKFSTATYMLAPEAVVEGSGVAGTDLGLRTRDGIPKAHGRLLAR